MIFNHGIATGKHYEVRACHIHHRTIWGKKENGSIDEDSSCAAG